MQKREKLKDHTREDKRSRREQEKEKRREEEKRIRKICIFQRSIAKKKKKRVEQSCLLLDRFSAFEVRSPATGFTAPLDAFLLFVCKEKPNASDFDMFDDFTEEQVKSYIPSSAWNLSSFLLLAFLFLLLSASSSSYSSSCFCFFSLVLSSSLLASFLLLFFLESEFCIRA